MLRRTAKDASRTGLHGGYPALFFGRLAEIPTDDDRLGAVAKLFESTRQPERRYSPGFTRQYTRSRKYFQCMDLKASLYGAQSRQSAALRDGRLRRGIMSRTSDKARLSNTEQASRHGFRLRTRNPCAAVPAPICRLAPRMEGRRSARKAGLLDRQVPPYLRAYGMCRTSLPEQTPQSARSDTQALHRRDITGCPSTVVIRNQYR